MSPKDACLKRGVQLLPKSLRELPFQEVLGSEQGGYSYSQSRDMTINYILIRIAAIMKLFNIWSFLLPTIAISTVIAVNEDDAAPGNDYD